MLINLWEEAAWAGFLQTRLERRANFFVAALLTGIPFAAIHMPLQVITGQVRSAVDFAVGFGLLMVLVIFVRSLFGMVLRGAANSLLLVGLTHAMFNRSNNSDGIVADLLPGATVGRSPPCWRRSCWPWCSDSCCGESFAGPTDASSTRPKSVDRGTDERRERRCDRYAPR